MVPAGAPSSPGGASPSESAPAAEHRVGRAAGPPPAWDEMIESLRSAGAVGGGMTGAWVCERVSSAGGISAGCAATLIDALPLSGILET